MKYAVAEITTILGEKCKRDLKIITAESKANAIEIYKSTRPHIDRYGFKVIAEEVQ